MKENYGNYCRPLLYQLLKSLHLDIAYHRAEGDKLWYVKNAQNIEVLDLVGGYGANLFGHNNPLLLEEIKKLYTEKLPFLVQGSCRTGAGQLAKALCDILGDYVVILTNSGTETVEAAIKHTYLQQKKSKYWAIKGAFHGKTLGAIQFNWNYCQPFEQLGPEIEFIDPFQSETYETLEAQASDVNAIFIEPILGEGGIHPLPKEFLDWLKIICDKYKIMMVADEIQTGMGRTGSFLASQKLNIDPDYICLSKSLGGGLVKIGALLIKRKHFIADFSVIHTSTFAEDEISSRVALKALEVLKKDQLITSCQVKGKFFLEKLADVKDCFLDQIKEIRGMGLMIGIDIQEQHNSASNTLRMLSKQNYLGYMASAYFLNYHQIRIAPTLSQPFTLRIEPSAYLSYEDIDYFVKALRMFCEAMENLDIVHLTGFQVAMPMSPIKDYRKNRRHTNSELPQNKKKVAFLGNLLDAEDGVIFDDSLRGFNRADLKDYLEHTSKILGPTLFDQVNVFSRTGDVVHLNFIGLNLTAKQIMRALAKHEASWVIKKINASATLATNIGCTVLGLGGHTSIVTSNCLKVANTDLALTSGNSLTIGMGLKVLKKAADKKNINLHESRLAIVGALGNIASVYSELMVSEVRELVLIVRDGTAPKVINRLVEKLKAISPATKVKASQDIRDINGCSLIVTASNSPTPLIHAKHLSESPIVICDISAPSDVHESVIKERPNTIILKGGLVKLPYDNDFSISGIPLERGHCFGCMAETLIMGLEGIETHSSYGKINSENVLKMTSLAEKHGFSLGEVKYA